MSYHIYHQSLDSATLTYSGTPDTDYPITNVQDRNKGTYFKDTTPGGASFSIKIDFGVSRTCDYLLLGNYVFDMMTLILLR